MAALYCLGS